MTIVPIRYVEPVYRPPSEADSLILPVTDGCSWNRCTFCEMYTAPQKHFRPSSEEEVLESIRRCREQFGDGVEVLTAVRIQPGQIAGPPAAHRLVVALADFFF